MDEYLNYQNFPKEDGTYFAGNFNKHLNRLEVAKVSVVGQDVYVENDPKPFIYTDFDFWSDKETK